jgi:hypothetical protein
MIWITYEHFESKQSFVTISYLYGCNKAQPEIPNSCIRLSKFCFLGRRFASVNIELQFPIRVEQASNFDISFIEEKEQEVQFVHSQKLNIILQSTYQTSPYHSIH